MDSDGQVICQQLPIARKTLRVAVVTETYPPEVNGVAMTIGRMVAGLRQRQHQVQLKVPRSSDFRTNFHSYSKHYGIGWLKKPIAAYLRKFHNKADCTLVPTASMQTELKQQGYLNLRVVARGDRV
jgi:hypothetical protein